MGKTPKPLRILVVDPCIGWEEWNALRMQGHDIQFSGHGDYDLIIGGCAWLMDEQHRKYLPLAIAEARRRRYPPTKKESA